MKIQNSIEVNSFLNNKASIHISLGFDVVVVLLLCFVICKTFQILLEPTQMYEEREKEKERDPLLNKLKSF